MSTFIQSATSRETSVEIMEAIHIVSGRDDAEAGRVWEDPTETELLAIWEIVTKNGLVAAEEFCWGASGSKWADGI